MSEIISYVPPETLLLAEGTPRETPEQRAQEINNIKAMARTATTTYAIAIGQRLLEVRGQVPAGSWMEWLRDNVDYSIRTAENLMGIAERFRGESRKLVEGVSMTTAVLLMGASDEDIAALSEEKPLEEYTTRELKAKLEEMRATVEKQQVTIDQLMAEKEPDPIEKNQVTMLQDAEERHRAEMDAAAKDVARYAKERREAENQRDAAKAEADRLRRELEKAAEATADMEIRLHAAEKKPADTLPPEVEEQLEKLRSIADKAEEQVAAANHMAAFKAGYAVVQQGWQAMMQAWAALEPEKRAGAKAAITRLISAMEQQVGSL